MKKKPHIFVDSLLKDALIKNAGDLYFIPDSGGYTVRFRIEGVQENIASFPRKYGEMCIGYIKSLAGLLTYKTKIPQDGVIRNDALSAVTDYAEMRVSTFPTVAGERVAVRIIKDNDTPKFLKDLNFQADVSDAINRLIRKPGGLIVLTGPTGSGKTSTIYAIIRELLKHTEDPASIMTIEDPVESVIDGISQTSVSGAGEEWNNAAAFRALLRQDVKTIVIGEMRDREVVKVALDAALTGHRVITTYHAGDIAMVYTRLLHQGVEPFLIAAAITGVVAQRLVPGANGKNRIPVASVLETNDSWRDFISRAPALKEIRAELSSYPLGSLYKSAEKMEKAGLIKPEWRLSI